MTDTTRTVGAFSFDTATGTLTGPAAFLASEDYRATIAKIRAGGDPCGAFAFSPDPATALLVTLQTSYAGWRGMQEIAAQMGGGR